ncbi:MAG TPA: YhjD/YihY/BrkB family envelope integrity protein [Euzebyales bacterium]|nr:YhjD/YihY/BrkB family envelope integrity protein [Euzebyales bacterium]
MVLSPWLTTARAVAADTARRARRQDLMLIAAGLTFYAGIAIVPLLLLGLYGAGLVLDPERVMTLVDRLAQYAPAAGAARFLRALGDAGPNLGPPALLASVVTDSTYGEGLLRAVDTLEGAQRPQRTLMGRLRVLPYLGVFPVVTLLGLIAVLVLPDRLGEGVSGRALGIYLTFWVGWLSATALLMVLYRLFAARTLRWAAIAWGSLAAGSFLTGMSLGWVLVLRFGLTIGRAFGGSELIGHIVLFTVYLLFVQVVLLLGYLLARSINDLGAPDVPPPPQSVDSGARVPG